MKMINIGLSDRLNATVTTLVHATPGEGANPVVCLLSAHII